MCRVRPLRHTRAPAKANGAYPLPRNPSSLETTRNNDKGAGHCQHRRGKQARGEYRAAFHFEGKANAREMGYRSPLPRKHPAGLDSDPWSPANSELLCAEKPTA